MPRVEVQVAEGEWAAEAWRGLRLPLERAGVRWVEAGEGVVCLGVGDPPQPLGNASPWAALNPQRGEPTLRLESLSGAPLASLGGDQEAYVARVTLTPLGDWGSEASVVF